ncbi:MAG: LysR family hydrogen peroxide-inducible transcriptional activator, partial [Halieaceae bacterium]
LTHQILALEGSLELQLFERSRAGTKLTPEGRELLVNAKRVLEETHGFADRAAMLSKGSGGTYRLGVTATLGPYLLPQILPHIHRRYASMKLHVREQAPRDLEAGLVAGDYDLILAPMPVGERSLTVKPLFEEPLRLVIAADHRLANKELIYDKDLLNESVLTIEAHHHFHQQIKELCTRLRAHMLSDYEGTSLDTLRQMIVMGMGIAFLPALYVRSEIHRPRELRIKKLHGKPIYRAHALAWRSSSPRSPMFVELANQIQELAGELFGDEINLVRGAGRSASRATPPAVSTPS